MAEQHPDRLKVIVFDDDPTGSQTVHGCPLLLRWDPDSLRRGLAHPSPLLFLLANSRALDPAAAAARLAEICQVLRPLLAEAVASGAIDRWMVVSRGDSTLRGHAPLELEVIAAELGPGLAPQLGSDPWDACLLVPAFLPGGRTTVEGWHLLHGEPVHTTAFGRDRLFGYSTSFLPAWLEQKSGGRIAAEQVQRITLAELDAAGADLAGYRALQRRLAGFGGQVWVAVDAERPQHLELLGAAVRELTAASAAERWGRPRRFLFQSAASLLNGLVALPEPALDRRGLAGLRRRDPGGAPLPGLVLVGSHVPLADAQLAELLQEPDCALVELEVAKLWRLLEGPAPLELLASLERSWLAQLQAVLAAGCTPVLASSRGELVCGSPRERRRLGLALAALMARLAAALAPQLGYLISKGGITSHTLLADGLALAQVELQGQLLPGLSLVLTPADAAVPQLPVLTFPGNLGDAGSLRQAWALMAAAAQPSLEDARRGHHHGVDQAEHGQQGDCGDHHAARRQV
ncbi:MAG: four-carbon acid sugar kinase family protein [Prochlorococcaceae cyanobacterium]